MGNIIISSIDFILNWGRSNSIWPLTFATSCCGIEMMQTSAANFDIARFGSEVFRPSPRQADLLICAGTITHKMAPALLKLYQQMPEPKYVIAMGACTCGGGMFAEDSYSVVKGIDKIIPVDIYLPMCPPTPEALLDSIIKLQKKIRKESILNRDELTVKHYSNLKEEMGLLVTDEGLAVNTWGALMLNIETLKEKFNNIELINGKILVNSDLIALLKYLKSDIKFNFDMLTTIVAVDMIDFIELNYILYSTKSKIFLTVSTKVVGSAPSVISVYKSAYFDECEIFDLFGIKFNDNKDLKRLLMPDSWIGHPLLKSYKQEDKRLAWNE